MTIYPPITKHGNGKFPGSFLPKLRKFYCHVTAGRYVMSFLHVGTACNNISEFHCSRIWRPSRMQIYPDPIHWFPQAPTMLEAVAGHSWFGIHRGVFAELRLQTLKQFVHLTFWSRGSSESNTNQVSKVTGFYRHMLWDLWVKTVKTLAPVWTLKQVVIASSSRKRMVQLVLTHSHIKRRVNKMTDDHVHIRKGQNWAPTSNWIIGIWCLPSRYLR